MTLNERREGLTPEETVERAFLQGGRKGLCEFLLRCMKLEDPYFTNRMAKIVDSGIAFLNELDASEASDRAALLKD